MDFFFTNFDLLAIFKNCKIVKYANLDQYSDIYQLLPNRMDFCFILTESEINNSGHWTLLIRDDNNFEYFDSYGVSPKNILDYIPNYMNKKLGNNYKEDTGKMINSIKPTDKFIYNKTKFQKEAPDINTCGRWVIARLSLFLSDDLDLNEFTKLIKTKTKQLKMTNDKFITFLVTVN
jgi:Ulp1 family protease